MCLPAARPAANSRHSTIATKSRKSSIWKCGGKLLKRMCPQKELLTKAAEHSLEEEEEELYKALANQSLVPNHGNNVIFS